LPSFGLIGAAYTRRVGRQPLIAAARTSEMGR
jgi:hypothetical protein